MEKHLYGNEKRYFIKMFGLISKEAVNMTIRELCYP